MVECLDEVPCYIQWDKQSRCEAGQERTPTAFPVKAQGASPGSCVPTRQTPALNGPTAPVVFFLRRFQSTLSQGASLQDAGIRAGSFSQGIASRHPGLSPLAPVGPETITISNLQSLTSGSNTRMLLLCQILQMCPDTSLPPILFY